tara:strand:+ start:57665 stop:57799 length:135 start_codon:yes stop_codon:yes gene_type:complete
VDDGDDDPVVCGFPKDKLIWKTPHQIEVVAFVALWESAGILGIV